MKKLKNSMVTVAVMMLAIIGFGSSSQAASNFGGIADFNAPTENSLLHANDTTTSQTTGSAVTIYWFPASGPSDSVENTFLTWADCICKPFCQNGGATITTGSRSNNPSGVGFQSAFEAGDVTIPNPSTTNCMWRFVYDPTDPYYLGQLGNIGRFPIMLIPKNGGKMSLSGVSAAITDTAGGTLYNVQSWNTSSYGRTAVGFNKGPSGVMFGDDASFLENGEAGTNMVDGICITGIRYGFWSIGQSGLDAINAYIPTNGDLVTCTYTYQWQATNGVMYDKQSKSVMLYRQGQIPENCKGKEIFPTPIGELFTLANEPEDQTWNVWVARFLNSPALNTNNPPYYTGATTGYSYTWPFVGGTNDVGFVRFENSPPSD